MQPWLAVRWGTCDASSKPGAAAPAELAAPAEPALVVGALETCWRATRATAHAVLGRSVAFAASRLYCILRLTWHFEVWRTWEPLASMMAVDLAKEVSAWCVAQHACEHLDDAVAAAAWGLVACARVCAQFFFHYRAAASPAPTLHDASATCHTFDPAQSWWSSVTAC